MTATVRWLLGRRALSLGLCGGAAGLDREIDCALTSELPAPHEWLSGGELLLTTGLRLPDTAEGRHRYVRALDRTGIAGLGFAVGMGFDEVPADLIAAAEEVGLPLFAVPLQVPFSAIARTVLDRLAEQRYDQFVRASRTQPTMTRAIVNGGTAGVVRALGDAIGQTVLLYDDGGHLITARPSHPPADVIATADAILGRERGSSSGVSITADSAVTVQRISVGRSTFGHLVVVGVTPPSDLERVLVGHATSLLTLEHAKPRQVAAEQARVHAELLDLAASGTVTPAMARLLDRAAGRDGRVRVVLYVFATDDDAEQGAEHLTAHLEEQWRAVFVRTDGREVSALVHGDDGVGFLDGLRGWFRTPGPDGVRVRGGLGPAVAVTEIAASARGARVAAGTAPDGELVDLDTERSVLAIGGVRSGLQGAYAPRLGPLLDAEHADLLTTLRAYLQANGQWEAASRAVGIHRHTLRQRVDRIERLLGIDLADARTRAELLLILLAN
ncbi:PucR family transcriptional regulator [Williamsia sterculiae]|nr:PucR family transcriptional regulator [Williamsia sterculiae]